MTNRESEFNKIQSGKNEAFRDMAVLKLEDSENKTFPDMIVATRTRVKLPFFKVKYDVQHFKFDSVSRENVEGKVVYEGRETTEALVANDKFRSAIDAVKAGRSELERRKNGKN